MLPITAGGGLCQIPKENEWFTLMLKAGCVINRCKGK
jgi:hypothetical protein